MPRRWVGAAAFLLLVVAACSAGTVVNGDGGSDGAAGDASADSAQNDATDAASSGDAADGAFAKCTRNTSLDSACVTKYGAGNGKAWTCTDVFFNPPPCQPLDTFGCTEVCENRCCP